MMISKSKTSYIKTSYKKIFFLALFLLICFVRNTAYAKDSLPVISITLDSGETPDISGEELVLVADRQDPVLIARNSRYFQKAVDYVSEAGGGTVKLPKGSFYFLADQKNFNREDSALEPVGIGYNSCEYHVIRCRDNVKICGETSETDENLTILYPIGSYKYPTDMFYFADLVEKEVPNYLVNADFENLTIDGAYTSRSGKYTAKGKGFYFLLFKDCDWDHVTVRNTDATGFGMDCPINCTIRNCTAYGCGRGATSSSVGASGFGIGFGYSSEESILIENCVSAYNRKFGFFFENQKRFLPLLYQELPDKLICRDCTGIGNMYDFGGEMAYNSWFYDCQILTQYPGIDNTLEIEHLQNFYFGNKSEEYHIIKDGVDITDRENNDTEDTIDPDLAEKMKFDDVKEGAWYYPGIAYMYERGLMQGKTDQHFGVSESLTRAQMAVILWRLEKSPKMEYRKVFPDIADGSWYTDAVLWADEAGIATGYANRKFGPADKITREQLATMLFRYAALKGYDAEEPGGLDAFMDRNRVSSYAKLPMQWCIKTGIITGKVKKDGTYLDPQAYASRAECAVMMMRFLHAL